MPARRIAEGLVILEHPPYVGVAKQRPLQIIAVGDRAALPHLVVDRDLVGKRLFGARVPLLME